MGEIILKVLILGEWKDGETIKKDSLLYCFLNTKRIQKFQSDIEIGYEKSEYNANLSLNNKKCPMCTQKSLTSDPKTEQKWNGKQKKQEKGRT